MRAWNWFPLYLKETHSLIRRAFIINNWIKTVNSSLWLHLIHSITKKNPFLSTGWKFVKQFQTIPATTHVFPPLRRQLVFMLTLSVVSVVQVSLYHSLPFFFSRSMPKVITEIFPVCGSWLRCIHVQTTPLPNKRSAQTNLWKCTHD